MAHYEVSHERRERPTTWWVLSAWGSLLLLVASGLAGAAGLG